VELSRADLIAAFAQFYRVEESGLAALTARVRHLQSRGIPEGSNPGKGRRVGYTVPMMIELLIAMELAQSGQSPRFIEDIIKAERKWLIAAALLALTDEDERREPVFIFSPEALAPTESDDGEGPSLLGALSIVDRPVVPKLLSRQSGFEPITGEPWRWILLMPRQMTITFFANIINLNDLAFEQGKLALTAAVDEWSDQITLFIEKRLNRVASLHVDEEVVVQFGDT